MVHVDLLRRRELDAVELVREQEHALDHVFELEVGLDQLVVHRIALVLVLFGIVGPVPGHDAALQAERIGVVVHRLVVAHGIVARTVEQVGQEVVHCRGPLGHAVFEHVIGIALVAQEVGDAQTQLGDALHDLRVVVLAAHAARVVRTPQPLLERAVRRVGQERHVARGVERHGPPLAAARPGLGGQLLAQELGQLGHLRRVVDVEREGVGRSQHVLTEAEHQLGLLGGVLAVELLILVRQSRTLAREAAVGLLQQLPVLLREAESRMLVHRLHAGEQLGIEGDVVLQLGQRGLHVEGDLLHLLRRVGLQQVEEKARNAVQQHPLALQRHDGVAERGLGRIVHDGLDLGAHHGDGRLECGRIVLRLDPRERRRLTGRIPLLDQQRVRGVDFRQLHDGHRIAAACRQKGK